MTRKFYKRRIIAKNEKRNAALLFSTSFGKEKLREVHKEGKIEGKIEIAKTLLAEGNSIENVARITGFSIDELTKWLSQL